MWRGKGGREAWSTGREEAGREERKEGIKDKSWGNKGSENRGCGDKEGIKEGGRRE